jgi:hypothetical protein
MLTSWLRNTKVWDDLTFLHGWRFEDWSSWEWRSEVWYKATTISEECIYSIFKVVENRDSISPKDFLSNYHNTRCQYRTRAIVQVVSRRFPVSVAKVKFMVVNMVLVHVFPLVLQFPLQISTPSTVPYSLINLSSTLYSLVTNTVIKQQT